MSLFFASGPSYKPVSTLWPNTFLAQQTVRAAAAQDGIALLGRAGGTSSYVATLTPSTLSASRTITVPDLTGTMAVSGAGQTVSFGPVTGSFAGDITNGDMAGMFGSGTKRVHIGHDATKGYCIQAVDVGTAWQDIRIQPVSGAMVIGSTDPGGSELLRVGGSIRAVSNCVLNPTTDTGSEGFICYRSGVDAYLRINFKDGWFNNDYKYPTVTSGAWRWRYSADGTTFATEMALSGGNLGIGDDPTTGNGAIQLATHTTRAGGIAVGPDAWIHREASYQTTIAQTADANGAILAFRDVTNSVFRGLIGYGAYMFNSGAITDFGITSYGALKLGSNGGTTGLTIDTSQNTTLAGNLSQTGGKYIYLRGDASTDGSVRISSQSDGTATIEKRSGGSWTAMESWA